MFRVYLCSPISDTVEGISTWKSHKVPAVNVEPDLLYEFYFIPEFIPQITDLWWILAFYTRMHFFAQLIFKNNYEGVKQKSSERMLVGLLI